MLAPLVIVMPLAFITDTLVVDEYSFEIWYCELSRQPTGAPRYVVSNPERTICPVSDPDWLGGGVGGGAPAGTGCGAGRGVGFAPRGDSFLQGGVGTGD